MSLETPANTDMLKYEIFKADMMQALQLVHKALITQEGKIQDMEQVIKELEAAVAVLNPPKAIIVES